MFAYIYYSDDDDDGGDDGYGDGYIVYGDGFVDDYSIYIYTTEYILQYILLQYTVYILQYIYCSILH